jgi:hypothetical protein
VAPTVISVRVRGRLAARRRVATKRALKVRLARWTAKRRYRRSAITVTIWRPVALPRGRDAASGSSRLTAAADRHGHREDDRRARRRAFVRELLPES